MTTTPVARPTAPLDNRLPGLDLLFVPARVTAIVAHHLGPGNEVVDGCEAGYVRYKPATSCVVTYVLRIRDADGAIHRVWLYGKCHTDSDFAAASAKIATHRWSPVAGMVPVIVVESEQVVFYLFPNDTCLAGLRLLAYPKRLRRFLAMVLSDFPPHRWRLSHQRLRVETVRWKAEKRALVRVRTQAVQRQTGECRDLCLYLRTYVDTRGERLFRLMEWLWDHRRDFSGPRVPRPLAWGALRRLLVVEGEEGSPLGEHWESPTIAARLAAVGRDLAALQKASAAPVPARSVRTYVDDARATARTLTQLVPHEAPRIERLIRTLARLAPRDSQQVRFVHGDFHPGQILVQDSGLVFLDFDRSHRGDGAADVGNFVAHLVLAEIEGCGSVGAHLAQAFLDAYEGAAGHRIDPDRLRFYTLLGLFQVCVRPFRELHPAWASQTLAILNACEDLVS